MTQSPSAFIAHLCALPLPALVLVIIAFTVLALVPAYLLSRVLGMFLTHRRTRRQTYCFADPGPKESLAVSLQRYASTKSSALIPRRLSTGTNARIPAHWPRAESPLASPFLPATGDLGGLITPFTLMYNDAPGPYYPISASDKMRRQGTYTAFSEPRRGDWVVAQLPELAAAAPYRTPSKRSALHAVTPVSPLLLYSPLAQAYEAKRSAIVAPALARPAGMLMTPRSGVAYPSPPPSPVEAMH